MPIRVPCSNCKTTLAVKDHLAGKRVKCPKCQAPLAVPAAPKPAAPAINQAELEALAAAALGDDPAPTGPATLNGSNGHAAAPPSASIKFNCEYCEAAIEIDAELAGKKAPCPECRHIIKVPLPKDDKPKDWRTVEKKGPSLAAVNQPAKIDNAWGTETKSRVSQTALLEAGVITKPKAPSIGIEGWIERGVKAAALFLVIGGIGWAIWNLRVQAEAKKSIDKLTHACDPKWPAVIQSEFHIIMAELALRQPRQRELAREHYLMAAQKVAGADDPRDKIDRDFFLIDLTKAQTKLGGDEMDIRGQDRYDWNQEVFTEIERTLKMIENPDARVSALRELAFLFGEIKKPEMAISLTNNVAAITPQAKAIRLALFWADGAKQAEAKRIAPLPEEGKGSIDIVARCGYAEGLVRKDKDKFADGIKIALRPGETSHKFQALIAIASLPALEAKNIKEACDMASELLKKDAGANIPPWVRLQHIRLIGRHDADEAKALAQKLPVAFQRRAKLEIALATLAKDPKSTTASAVIQELDKEGPGRALAWLAVARHKARANLSFTFTPENPEDEMLRPFFKAVEVCPATPTK